MKANPIASRRRHMRGLVQGIAAVALAVIAQGILYRRVAGLPVDVPAAIVLFLLASILIYRAAGSVSRTGDGIPPTDWHFPRFSDQQTAGWSFAVIAVVANLTALVLFGKNVQLNLAWLFYAASAACAVAAAYYLDPPAKRSLSFRLPRFEFVALVVILLVAAFFRFYRIGSLPAGLWFDEAQQGLASLRILSDPGFRPVWLTGISPDPAMRMYWQALFFAIFGPTKLALRLIPVVGGIFGVLAAYLLARELFGWRTGMVSAAILAVLSWHVDFSRIDLGGVWAVAFDALAAYFLLKGIQTRRFLSYGLAGLCLGLGINSYYTSYLFCVVVVLYTLHRLARGRLAYLRASLGGLIILAITLLLTASPVVEFALLHRDEYSSRFNQVNIFKEIDQQHSIEPLVHNVVAHVLMFNYRGDANGRHNLSGWPELDPLTGGLFVLGIVICLRNWRHPNYFLPVLSLLVILLGGILSVDFEAPQSVRTVDNSLNSAILAAIPLGLIWSFLADLRLGRISLPLGRSESVSFSTGALATLGLLAWVTGVDFQRYFVIQANDNASFAAYSIGPTLLAETMNRLGPGYDVYMSSTFVDQPSIKFLDPQITTETPLDPAADLPLRDHRNVAIFLETRDADYVNAIRRTYPSATYGEYRLSPRDPVVLYSAIVPSSQIEALKGLAASYYPGRTTDQPAAIRRVDKTLDFDWSNQAPLRAPFVASWKGVILAPSYGTYEFRLGAPADSILKIDQREVLKGSAQTSLSLAQGLHAIELTAPFTDLGSLHLWWKRPGAGEEVVPEDDLFHLPADNRGLMAQYYRNADWSGAPALERIDVSLSQRFHFLPLPQPFTVEWSGKIDIPQSGVYRFGTQSIDSSWLYIDNVLVVDNSRGPDRYVDGPITLTEGLHDIRVRFLDRSGHSFINVYWQPPGAGRSFLPGDRLFPPQAAYPERAGPLRQNATIPQPSMAPPTQPPSAAAQSLPAKLPASPLAVKRTFGSLGHGAGQLSDPRGVAVDRQGNVYVVDTGNQRVVEFSQDGKQIRVIGGPGQDPGRFQEPVAAVVSPNDNLAVLDSADGWINLFKPDGTFIGRFGGPSDQFYHPRGIDVDASGNFYVADTGTAHVVVLSSEGALLKRLGDPARRPGPNVMQPVSVAVDPRGSLFVTDAGNGLLLRNNQDFVQQERWTLSPFDSVKGAHVIALPDGNVYVTDPSNHRVVHFDPEGKPRDQLSGEGQLARPVGVAGDLNGNIYVVDADGGKVLEYGK